MLSEAEQSRDLVKLVTLKDLLAYEAETWHLLLQNPASDTTEQSKPMAGVRGTQLPAPITANYNVSDDFSSDGSFSLEV